MAGDATVDSIAGRFADGNRCGVGLVCRLDREAWSREIERVQHIAKKAHDIRSVSAHPIAHFTAPSPRRIDAVRSAASPLVLPCPRQCVSRNIASRSIVAKCKSLQINSQSSADHCFSTRASQKRETSEAQFRRAWKPVTVRGVTESDDSGHDARLNAHEETEQSCPNASITRTGYGINC